MSSAAEFTFKAIKGDKGAYLATRTSDGKTVTVRRIDRIATDHYFGNVGRSYEKTSWSFDGDAQGRQSFTNRSDAAWFACESL